ncbi:MAG TPA: hypothetical protein VFN42_13880, partial [Acetobacteraceae bacterium]|nr:hypothetical protein [Acetobacteraceae bacterium]
KFNLFLRIAARSLALRGEVIAVPGGRLGGLAGIVLMAAGTAMVALAAVRFVRTNRAIDSPEPGSDGARIDLLLAGLMVLLGLALVVYLSHTVTTGV